MNDRTYIFDSELRIWRTPTHDSIAYSDGDEVERRLLSILKQTRDLSSTSDELRKQIVEWPTEYHFSPTRANLLRPFRIDKSQRILELGCGCGNLTRYLGESGAHVTAVEGSVVRASIAAERCRDLANVMIVADSIELFTSAGGFDMVTLIGVLEYAPLFFAGDNPALQCLAAARHLLAPGGTMLLAIENQLGLKYFNGCTEDHTRKLFFGVQDQYSPSTPVTFGRTELKRLVETVGFSHTHFLFPFPDYKLPEILISEEAQTAAGLSLYNLLTQSHGRDYSGHRLKTFDEHLVWRAIERNGLIGDLANSFLIVASTDETNVLSVFHDPWLAKIYAASRKPAWASETTIRRNSSGLRVGKSGLGIANSKEIAVGSFTLSHQLSSDEPYLPGDLLLHKFQRLAPDGDLEKFAKLARQWLDFLLQGNAPGGVSLSDRLVPGHYLDCIPANLIVTDTGVLTMIDLEWHVREPIPLAWVILRGLVNTLYQCTFPDNFGHRNCQGVIAELLSLMDVDVKPATYEDVAVLETAFQEACRDDHLSRDDFRVALANAVPQRAPVERACEVEMLVARIEAYENSLSWRITRPLRYLARVLLGRK